jgi:nucleoside-triphosphatase THEP1
MNKIFLLSGPIHTGKTTRLTEWVKTQGDVDGILQPEINGKRHIKHISSGEIRLLEILKESNEKNIITIGNYNFSNEVFKWAHNALLAAFYSNPDWLIIDEYGKLELIDKGLEPVVSKILNELIEHPDTKIIFIIRDYLVNSFLDKYSLNNKDIEFLEI